MSCSGQHVINFVQPEAVVNLDTFPPRQKELVTEGIKRLDNTIRRMKLFEAKKTKALIRHVNAKAARLGCNKINYSFDTEKDSPFSKDEIVEVMIAKDQLDGMVTGQKQMIFQIDNMLVNGEKQTVQFELDEHGANLFDDNLLQAVWAN